MKRDAAVMARLKTHKFAIQTKGLTDEEAARLFYVIASAGRAFTEDYQTASNVPLELLRSQYDDAEWILSKRQDRLDLVNWSNQRSGTLMATATVR